MPPRASTTKKATPKRPPSPTPEKDDPSPRAPPTINKEIALAIILARLDATRDMDWYGLSLDLGASHGVAREDGGKKRGRKSEEGLTGTVLRDMYYSIILPALKAGKTPWEAASVIFLTTGPCAEHHEDNSSRTVRAVQSVDEQDIQDKPESTVVGATNARVVPSALTKKDPNIQTVTVAPVTPHQSSKRQLDMDDKAGSPKRKRIRVYTSTSKRRFKRESSEEEEWSMSSEEAGLCSGNGHQDGEGGQKGAASAR